MIRTLVLAITLVTMGLGVSPAGMARDNPMPSAHVSTAMDFLTAIGAGDFDTAGDYLDTDAVLELPFAGEGITMRGREGVLAFFRKSMAGSVARVDYTLDHAWPSPEVDAVILEISTMGRKADGEAYTNRLVAIFTFRDGRILLLREYFNPVPLG